jgi:hypothetical protein
MVTNDFPDKLQEQTQPMPIFRRTRKEKFKDLMRNRTTVEQGLTLSQIFCEVYSDVVEKYLSKKRSVSDDFGGDVVKQIECYEEGAFWKIIYLRRMIKQVRKTDDDFRWLSIMPVKRNEVNKTTGKKVRPYLEYRYINIKASETPELLEQVHQIWLKHTKGVLRGLEKTRQRLRAIAEMTSTPEGRRLQEMNTKALIDSIELKMKFLSRKNHIPIDKMVEELKQENRLPQGYKTNYGYIREILQKEILNQNSLAAFLLGLPADAANDEIKRRQEVRKLMKDTIEAYCDKKQIEKEQAIKAKKYDWESLEYR